MKSKLFEKKREIVFFSSLEKEKKIVKSIHISQYKIYPAGRGHELNFLQKFREINCLLLKKMFSRNISNVSVKLEKYSVLSNHCTLWKNEKILYKKKFVKSTI